MCFHPDLIFSNKLKIFLCQLVCFLSCLCWCFPLQPRIAIHTPAFMFDGGNEACLSRRVDDKDCLQEKQPRKHHPQASNVQRYLCNDPPDNPASAITNAYGMMRQRVYINRQSYCLDYDH